MIAFERVVNAFRNEGLNVKDTGHGKASAQAPGHSHTDLSVLLTAIDGQVLIYSYANEPTDQILDGIGLTMSDLFDTPKGAEYRYPDNRVVRRTPDKKFFQSGNTKGRSLYRADRIAEAAVVYFVEGEKDVHALESIGAAAVSTAGGAGKAHNFDLTPLHGKTVRVVCDKDAPGKAHALQIVDILDSKSNVEVVQAASGKDAADHIAAGYGLDDFVVAPGFDSIGRTLNRVVDEIAGMERDDALTYVQRELDALHGETENPTLHKFDSILGQWWEWIETPDDKIRTIPTPWPELDDVLAGGMHPGRSYIIAARPGHGKSIALSNFASYAAQQGRKGVLFSVEMGRVEVASRIIAAGALADYGRITRRQLDDFSMGRIAKFVAESESMPLWISDQASLTIAEIGRQARELKNRHGLDFVAVDYVQLVKPGDSKSARERQISEISWALKNMSKELDIVVVAACQINRGSTKEKRPPTIADLRESGSLEQDCDVAILLHHELIEGQPTGEVEMIVGKNRTGKLCSITLPWRSYQARIG